MTFTPPISDPGANAIRRYINGAPESETFRYLELGGNFITMPTKERIEFLQDLGHDARQVTDAELEFLLLQSDWGSRIVAAWMIGLDRREQFRDRLGKLLNANEFTHAGSGYCIALALLGTRKDAAVLTTYLNRYLRRPDCRYDQHTALGALLHLDHALDTDHAGPFLVPDGLWERWASVHTPTPSMSKRGIDQICALADQHARGTADPGHA